MEHVSREWNQEVDRISQLAMVGFEMLHEATVVELVEGEASKTKEVMNNAPESEGVPPVPWYQTVLDNLRTGTLPEDPPVANKIQRQSVRYTLLDGVLYQRSFHGPLLKCVTKEEGLITLEEVHEGMCGSRNNGTGACRPTPEQRVRGLGSGIAEQSPPRRWPRHGGFGAGCPNDRLGAGHPSPFEQLGPHEEPQASVSRASKEESFLFKIKILALMKRENGLERLRVMIA
ncbi:hypothetical protein LIER_20324 [Lithospermum erythrorhizon]|uniref:Uncharacterized protein n=1 Tax=Lithospermum erythrorhizon TaxID=34254 RepID=A0AAV3QM64_LITER